MPTDRPGRHSVFGRMGRGAKSPPQFGQTFSSIRSTQAAQNVHSKVQIRASLASGGKSLSQHSQLGRSSRAMEGTLVDGRPILIRLNLAEMTKATQKPPKSRSVEIVAFADAQLLDVAGPLQVLATANEVMATRKAPIPYAPRVVAPQPVVVTSAGLVLNVAPLPPVDAAIDTLVIAGGRGIHIALKDPKFVRWLKNRSKRARRIASVCTGAFALGAIGLLDGRRATTHWMDAAALAARTPNARVETEPIFIRDGNISTSAGVTAGIDLMLAFVEEDLGHGAALAVARELVVYLRRPGGQSQFSAVLKLQSQDPSFDELHAWIASHLTEDLSVAALATHMGMSERTFVRRYTAAVGVTPARVVERLRTEAVRQLLTSTTLPIKRVAERCGFGSEDSMRRSLMRDVSATPLEYRSRFAIRRPDD